MIEDDRSACPSIHHRLEPHLTHLGCPDYLIIGEGNSNANIDDVAKPFQMGRHMFGSP
jgi:hypothetical protein